MCKIKLGTQTVVALTFKSDKIGKKRWLEGSISNDTRVIAYCENGLKLRVYHPSDLYMDPPLPHQPTTKECSDWYRMKKEKLILLFDIGKKKCKK